MENKFLRVPSVLYDLQKFSSEESAFSTLTTLNEIISSSQDEMEFLCNSGGITVIMSYLEKGDNLEKTCLKLLASSSKRHAKVRKILLENNIFHLLAAKLKKERDFSKNILILYCALIVVLVRGDYEAQNQEGTRECLNSLIDILSSILDEADQKPLPGKNTELIIYAIITSYKNPRHIKNQTQAGLIIPKILEYLERETVYSDIDQLQLAKYFWFLLRTVLDKNEVNQQIFLRSFGLSILFRSLQGVIEVGYRAEIEELLIKITGVLVKLKSHKEFLFEASNYCPVTITCNFLKTHNRLVIQQIIIYLDSLTREFPQSLQLMRSSEILKQIEHAEIVFINTKTGKLCRDLWNRIENFAGVYHSQESALGLNQQPMFSTFSGENLSTQEIPISRLLENHFCVVHGRSGSFFDSPEIFFNYKKKAVAMKAYGEDKIRFFGTHLNSYTKESPQKEQKLSVAKRRFSLNRRVNRFSILGVARRKIIHTFKRLVSFFH